MKINFIDKIAINAVEGDERNWLTADNINEIKNAVNFNEETLTNLQTTTSNYENIFASKTELTTSVNTINNSINSINTQINNLNNQTFPFIFGRDNEELYEGLQKMPIHRIKQLWVEAWVKLN